MHSLTGELVDLIRAKPVTPEDLVAASHFVLDTVACAIGGQTAPAGRILADWHAGAAHDAGRQAFLASGLAHILEIDDLHRDSVTHPGCVVIPAAWILAAQQGRSGREFLTAVLHGYEAMTRIGMAVGAQHYKVWHNTSTCGPFGSAMAAVTLLGLDREQAIWALGNAGTQACGLWQFLADDAMSKFLHTARAAEAGWAAATLSKRGFTGAARILEGEQGLFRAMCPDADPGAILGNAGGPWQLRRTSMKPWPCCRHTHPAIDAALELHSAADGAAPTSIVIRTYQAALDVCDRPTPDTDYTAKFSLQHCVAAALMDGEIGFDAFGDAPRARLRELAHRAKVEVAADCNARYPGRWGAVVEVTLPNGAAVSAVREDCKGDPELPLSAEEIAAKAERVMAEGGGAVDVAGIIGQILRLPTAPSLGALPLAALGGV